MYQINVEGLTYEFDVKNKKEICEVKEILPSRDEMQKSTLFPTRPATKGIRRKINAFTELVDGVHQRYPNVSVKWFEAMLKHTNESPMKRRDPDAEHHPKKDWSLKYKINKITEAKK